MPAPPSGPRRPRRHEHDVVRVLTEAARGIGIVTAATVLVVALALLLAAAVAAVY